MVKRNDSKREKSYPLMNIHKFRIKKKKKTMTNQQNSNEMSTRLSLILSIGTQQSSKYNYHHACNIYFELFR